MWEAYDRGRRAHDTLEQARHSQWIWEEFREEAGERLRAKPDYAEDLGLCRLLWVTDSHDSERSSLFPARLRGS